MVWQVWRHMPLEGAITDTNFESKSDKLLDRENNSISESMKSAIVISM